MGASRLYGCATRREYGPGTDGAEVYKIGAPWAPMGPHGPQWGPIGPKGAPWGLNYVKLMPHPGQINRNELKLGLDLIRTPQKNIADVRALNQIPADWGAHWGGPMGGSMGNPWGNHREPMGTLGGGVLL